MAYDYTRPPHEGKTNYEHVAMEDDRAGSVRLPLPSFCASNRQELRWCRRHRQRASIYVSVTRHMGSTLHPVHRLSAAHGLRRERRRRRADAAHAGAGDGAAPDIERCRGGLATARRLPGRCSRPGKPADGSRQYDQREREHSERILSISARHPGEFDLIHDESGSFFRHAAECRCRCWRRCICRDRFIVRMVSRTAPPNLYFNCVSHSQAASFRRPAQSFGVVQNGIDVERFPFSRAQR